MIILYDEAEKEFTSLGIGVLRDCHSCVVSESLNDTFELQLQYPINGSYYKQLRIGRIIGAKPNPYDSIQPFRIQSITKPLKGIVTVIAYHISYDMNGVPVKQIDATGLNDALSQIQNGAYIANDFALTTNIASARKFKTTAPFNMRAILMGDDEESLLGVYDAEVKFDKFRALISQKRGKNRGAKVCYAYNMTDLKHETNNERLFNGVFPYYHKETTSTETVTNENFAKVYIVGSKPFQDGWLSYTKNGEAYHPVDNTPVQIDTEGDYYEKVYAWNVTYQKYEEKIYNESVTLIEGVVEPTWILIDWSKFPSITCRANAKGYFKSMTDDKWSEIKGVGDVIFEGNVLKTGLTGMASNMIIYYSEVIPSGAESETKEVTETVDVTLDEPIISVTTSDAKSMKYNRVLCLDLTSEFDEEPSKEKLKAKAEEYISKNLVGTIYETTEVSFIDLATTTEKDKYQNFNHIELGDTVRVIYQDLGVDVELRVITTQYDALAEGYTSVTLGKKSSTLSNTTIQNGDKISSLSNDIGYADITTVNKLIAKTVTAEYIQAVDAKLSKAQIEELQVAKISCPGIIEASQFIIDELVATLLTAENAKISGTLEAGTIKVAGDITITSGAISIMESGATSFLVDREGNVTANSVSITGGTFNINEGVFEVTNDGTLYAKNAHVEGEIVATSGEIGGCEIKDGVLKISAANIGELSADKIKGGSISASAIKLGTNIGSEGEVVNFYADVSGNVTATSIAILGGSISGATINIGNGNFVVNEVGIETINRIECTGSGIFETVYCRQNLTATKLTVDELVCRGSVDFSSLGWTTDTITVNSVTFTKPGSRKIDVTEEYILTYDITSSGEGAVVNFSVKCQIDGKSALVAAKRTITVTVNYSYTNAYGKRLPGTKQVVGILTPMVSFWSDTVDISGNNVMVLGVLIDPTSTSYSKYVSDISGLGVSGNFMPLTDNSYTMGHAQYRWSTVYAGTGTINTSDRNFKSNINYDISRYEDLFDDLKPASFKFIDGTSGRTHLGFISQDVENSLVGVGISDTDFAGFIKTPKVNNEGYIYGLRYSELHALEVYQIQKLKERVKALEDILNETN